MTVSTQTDGYQKIRWAIEEPIRVALTALTPSIPSFTDNQLYSENDSLTEFALIRVNFGLTTELNIGCESAENIRGSLVVDVFTQKGTGPGRAQAAAIVVSRAMNSLTRARTTPAGISINLGQIRGPAFTPLDGRPHLHAMLTAGFGAQHLFDVP
jgi:hypothetical protein